MVELELPGKSWTALNKVLAPRGKKSQVHWVFLPLLILKQDLSFSIENCTRWLTGWQNVGMRRVMVQMANQHLIARRQISSGHDKSAGASRSSSKYFSAPGKIFPDHHQNISRASSEYFQIDDDLISTDFLIAVNSPVSRCSKFEANPFGMWDDDDFHCFHYHHNLADGGPPVQENASALASHPQAPSSSRGWSKPLVSEDMYSIFQIGPPISRNEKENAANYRYMSVRFSIQGWCSIIFNYKV